MAHPCAETGSLQSSYDTAESLTNRSRTPEGSVCAPPALRKHFRNTHVFKTLFGVRELLLNVTIANSATVQRPQANLQLPRPLRHLLERINHPVAGDLNVRLLNTTIIPFQK